MYSTILLLFLVIILAVLLFISIAICFNTIKVVKKVNLAEKQEVKNKYPELTDLDEKYRKANIQAYARYYLYTPTQRLWFTLSSLGSFSVLSCAIFSYFIMPNSPITMLATAIAAYFVVAFYLSQPSISKQVTFWEKYLEENPENPLKVHINRKMKNSFKLKLIGSFSVIATSLLFLGIIFYFIN